MAQMMRAVYVSTLLSEATFARCFPDPAVSPGRAVQKYHRLLSAGLAKNGVEVIALSAPPMTRQTAAARCVRLPAETVSGVRFCYLPAVLLPGIKHIVTFFCAFFQTLPLLTKDSFVIADALNVSVSTGARFAAFLRRRPAIGIVTDVPDLMGDHPTPVQRFNRRLMAKYDAYLLLTRQMSDRINPHDRPFLVEEGHVDEGMRLVENDPAQKDKPPVLLYAGMLHARYGILRLAEAFSMTQLDARLVIYGAGDAEETLRKMAECDPRIRLMGQAVNRTVVAKELAATLLINPRPSDAEFTKYSFPSKNMEYMVSGTPVLTTRLPGMPAEYEPYVYLFDGETPAEMAKSLERVMAQGEAALAEKGRAAQSFVLEHKNNVSQAARLAAFAAGLMERAGGQNG